MRGGQLRLCPARPSLLDAIHRALYDLFFERDVLSGGRKIGRARRWHLERLGRRLERRPAGRLEPVPELGTGAARELSDGFIPRKCPAVLRGAARSWPAVGKWSFDWFEKAYGDQPVNVGVERIERSAEGVFYEIGFETHSFASFAGRVKQGADLYLRFTPILERFPELLEDLDFDALSRWSDDSRSWCRIGNEFYMGGRDSCTHLHTEMSDILHVCVSGRKRWVLHAPDNWLTLYPIPARTSFVASEVDFSAPDLAIHPWYRYASGYETVLEEGDILYVPCYFWHAVQNLAPSISVNYLWHRRLRSFRSLPLAYLNCRALVKPGIGTAEQFLAFFGSAHLPSLHAGAARTP